MFKTYFEYKFCIELLIAIAISTALLPKKKHFWVSAAMTAFCVCFVAHFANYGTWKIEDPLIQMITAMIRFFLIFAVAVTGTFFCLKVKGRVVMFCCISAYAMQHLAFRIHSFVNAWWTQDMGFWSDLAAYLGIYLICYGGVFLLLIRKFSLWSMEYMSNRKVVPLCTMMLLLTVFVSRIYSFYREEVPFGISFCITAYSASCVLMILLIQYAMFQNKELENEMEEKEYIYRLRINQAKMSKENIELINMKYHDLKHFVSGFRGRIKEEDLKQIQEKIRGYDAFIRTGSDKMDVIIVEKNINAERKGIETVFFVNGKLMDFMDEMDLFSLFGNLLDNAFNAADQMEKGKRSVKLVVKENMGLILIHCENYCARKVEFVNGMPQTTGEKNFHGFGTKSIQNVVKKYKGTMRMKQENDLFLVDISFYKNQ